VITFCPRCGAQFPVEISSYLVRTDVRCRDCRLAPTEVPPVLAPSEDEVSYDLSDWPVIDRGPVTAALVEMTIPYRWETGLVLVVPAAVEEAVDRLLEEFQGVAADQAGATEEGDEDADGGEEAQEAMSGLFVAADRLQHSPFDEKAAMDFAEATAAVGACLPPYGIEHQVWTHIQERAAAVVSDLEKADDYDLVGADARALRDFLRDYV
jgi:hypothetical protein